MFCTRVPTALTTPLKLGKERKRGLNVPPQLKVPRQLKVPPQLKVPRQFDVFVSLISNSFCEKSNLHSIRGNMLARLCNFYM